MNSRLTVCVTVVLSLLSGHAFAGDVFGDFTWTGAGGDFQWTNAANWSHPTLPDTSIPGVGDGDGEAAYVTVTDTIIFNPPDGVVATITDLGIAIGGDLQIENGELIVQGSANVDGYNYQVSVVNDATLTFNTHPSPTVSGGLSVGAAATLNLDNPLRISSMPGTSGILGTVNFTDDDGFANAEVIGAWQSFNFGPAAVTGDVKIGVESAGWISINTPEVHSLRFDNGTVTTWSEVTITDNLDWAFGRFYAGTWNVAATATATISGSSGKTHNAGTINYYAPITMTGDGNLSFSNGTPPAVMNVFDTFVVSGPGIVTGGSASPGLINVEDGGVFDTRGVDGAMNATSFHIKSGGIARLGSPGGQTLGQTLTINTGGTLKCEDSLTIVGVTTVGLDGTISPVSLGAADITFGTATLHSTTLAGFSQVNFNSDLIITGDSFIESPALLFLNIFTITSSSDSVTFTRNLQIDRIQQQRGSGTLRTEGVTTKETSGQILLRDSSVFEIAGPLSVNANCNFYLRVNGRIDIVDGGRLGIASGVALAVTDSDGVAEKMTIHAGGRLNLVEPGALLTLTSAPMIIDGGVFNLEGAMLTTAGNATIDQNAGTTRIMSGAEVAMDGSTAFRLHGGQLMGIGTISGNGLLHYGGRVRPGANTTVAGNLTIDGNYTQDAGGGVGVLAIDIFDASTNDTLTVNGTATLLEKLIPSLRGSYTPATDDRYTIVVGPNSGSFSNLGGLCIDQFIAEYFTGTNVDLVYLADCGPADILRSMTTLPAIAPVSTSAAFETVTELIVAGVEGTDATIWTDAGGGLVKTPLAGLGGGSSSSTSDVGADEPGAPVSAVGSADDGSGMMKPVRWARDGGGTWSTAEELPGGASPGGEATTMGLTPTEPTGDLIGGWTRDADAKPQATLWSRPDDLSAWTTETLPKVDPTASTAVTDLSRAKPGYATGVETGATARGIVWYRDPAAVGGFNIEMLPNLPGGNNSSANTIIAWDADGVTRYLVEGWADDSDGLKHAVRWEHDGFSLLGPTLIGTPGGADESAIVANEGGNRILGDEVNDILGDEINYFASLGSATTAGAATATAWFGQSTPLIVDLNDYAEPSTTLTHAVAIGHEGAMISDAVFTLSPAAGGSSILVGVVLREVICPTDLDGDGSVGFGDLVTLLSSWGPCVGCPADLDGNGTVGFADLVALLAAWGPCV